MNALQGTGIPTTAILGVGSMGGAILKGLLAPSIALSGPIRITTMSDESKQKFVDLDEVIAHSLESDRQANTKAVRDADLIILGVKPHHIKDLAEEIAPHIKPDATVISVAAGVTIDTIKEALPEGTSVIRAMPNTPVLVGNGVTGIVAQAGIPGEVLDVCRRLFETVGEVVMLDADDEAKLDAVAAISGGGPAYVYFFMEKMIAAALQLGFTDEQAKTMVEKTFLGSALLLQHQLEHPKKLRENVTSPNGTTEQAIKVLEAANLDEAMREAFDAAIARASEMARENR